MLAHLKTATSKQQFITQNTLFCSGNVFPSPFSLSSRETLQMAVKTTSTPQAKQ